MVQCLSKLEKDFKGKTANALYNYFNKNKNLANFIDVARQMLVLKGTNPLIRGEVCEVVLEVILKEFIKKNNLESSGWFVERGLILNDKSNPLSDYLTELDLVLFTPKLLYVFECKSYKGEKQLRDKGSLYVKHNKKFDFKLDVYEQNRKHSIALLKYALPHLSNKTSDTKFVKMSMFDFSIGEYEDLRDTKVKNIFPLLDDKTVLSLFRNYNNKVDCWDMRSLKNEISLLSKDKEVLTKEHLKYVKSIKR